MCLNLSPSISRRLVLPWVLLIVGERGLLVACGAAVVRGLWVWSSAVIGWVSVILLKVTDALAIPCIRKVRQGSLLKEAWIIKCNFYMAIWQIDNHMIVTQMLVTSGGEESHPGDDWEEGEGHDSPGSISSDRGLRGFGPLVGQDTEADEPQ